MNIVAPESLIFWTTLIFIILFILLRKFAWKPILGAVTGREASINDALEAAEKAKLEMRNMHADNEKLLKEARAEREEMIKEARNIKTKMISEAKEEARVEADKMIVNAQNAIEIEKKLALAELKKYVAELSLDIAEKVVKQELSSKDKQMELVDEMLAGAKLN